MFFTIFCFVLFFFCNDTATTEIYTLSLHDALPICPASMPNPPVPATRTQGSKSGADRKSTRLNSSHDQISYAVFCLKKKQNKTNDIKKKKKKKKKKEKKKKKIKR